MAQFTSRGGLKLLFIGDGASLALEPRDPFQYRLGSAFRSFHVHKRKVIGSRARPWSSIKRTKSSKLSADAILNASDDGVSDDSVEYDSHEETDEFACFRGLVLDISYRKTWIVVLLHESDYWLAYYRPVNVVCWKRAICLEFMEKADVLEYYDQTVSSPSGSFYIPAVLRVRQLLQVVKRRRIKSNLSRKNILFRDSFTCQYCSSRENLTIDHVIPVSRGGEWKWENLVAACIKCNSKKGKKTPEEANMPLLKDPKVPKDYDILAIPLTGAALRMLRVRKGTPEEWHQYLPQHSSKS